MNEDGKVGKEIKNKVKMFHIRKDFADIFSNRSEIPNKESVKNVENNQKYRLEIISIFILNWINIEKSKKIKY